MLGQGQELDDKFKMWAAQLKKKWIWGHLIIEILMKHQSIIVLTPYVKRADSIFNSFLRDSPRRPVPAP